MKKRARRAKTWTRIRKVISTMMLVSGVICAMYPFISDFLGQRYVSTVAHQYEKDADQIDQEEKELHLKKARAYNKALQSSKIALTDPFHASLSENASQLEEILQSYDEILKLEDNDSIMGFVEVPSVDIYLPIFHGCSEKNLKLGAGHLQGSSLPVGGKGTHCVLAAHTGLHTAKMFTDLHEVKEGDYFYLHVLGDQYAYQVDQIKVVLPEKTEDLLIVDGEDLVTLLTCTPYGVNDHRLLVRGHRVKVGLKQKEKSREKRDSLWMKEYKNLLIAGACILALLLLISFIKKKHR